MYDATCLDCGQAVKLPINPKGRNAYCRICYDINRRLDPIRRLWAKESIVEIPTITNFDGTPCDLSSPLPIYAADVQVEANAELLDRLNRNPALFRELSPRKFEEIVAEVLDRLGYSVELTPATNDGGFDICAAKSERTGGRFLYLVECKRYVPPSKVGVGIVRALHGVVQQRRATAGLIITTSFFTKNAEIFQEPLKYQLHLKNFNELQDWVANALTGRRGGFD